MRIDAHGQSIDKVTLTTLTDNENKSIKISSVGELKPTNTESNQDFTKEKFQKAVDSVNELLIINSRELKFVFHEGLEQYFVQLVDSNTDEVVREIPPKKLLDVFYEMQKLAGMIIDEKV